MDPIAILTLLSGYVPDQWKPAIPGVLAVWVAYCLTISKMNAMVRAGTEAGKTYALWSLRFLSVANVPAVNPDKAFQFWRGYRGPSVAPGTSLPKSTP
jgi:hypothetical protein